MLLIEGGDVVALILRWLRGAAEMGKMHMSTEDVHNSV